MTLKARARGNSIHVMLFYSGGCNGCDIEAVNALLSPRYDMEQYKVLFTWNPREADVLVVSGIISWQMLEPLKKLYSMIPDPKAVVAIGSCPINGNVYKNLVGDIGANDEIFAPLENIIPVDVRVPGCPPRPEDMLVGVVKAIPKLLEAP